MNNFLTELREYYDTLFPIITDENIARRTIIFYALLYLSLFFTGYSVGQPSASIILFTVLSYLLFGLTTRSFILSKQKPDPVHFFKFLKGFNLFIALFMLYIGLVFLFGSFLNAFDINLLDWNYGYIIALILLAVFLIFSFIILFYYIGKGTKGAFSFMKKKAYKNVTSNK